LATIGQHYSELGLLFGCRSGCTARCRRCRGAFSAFGSFLAHAGGPPVQASGLALNMQPLMDMVKTDKLTVTAPARVLVKTAPDKIAAGFELVRGLQDAGFGAEVYLGGAEVNYRWVALVKGNSYIVTEVETGQTLKLDVRGMIWAAGSSVARPARAAIRKEPTCRTRRCSGPAWRLSPSASCPG